MRYCICFILFTTAFTQISLAQNADSLLIESKNGITKHSILSTHPFGIFISRLQGNFRKTATQETIVKFSIESGNVWGTPITTYIPNDEETRDLVRDIPWHQAQYFFDEESLDAESFSLQIDGVIKGLRSNVIFGVGKNQELSLGMRLFMLTKGRFPFSVFTNDEFIEFFHENIGGGEDPFDRGVFGYNQALIKYQDRNGNTMTLENNDLIIGGLETSYYFYPESLINNNRSLHFNFGTNIGLNLSQYNFSVDIGMSANAIKEYLINDRSKFQIGLNLGVLRKNMVDLNNNNVDFGNNNFLGNLESAIEYSYVSNKGTIHSFSANFYVQSSYNKISERPYIIPVRHPDAHDSWGHGVTNLYEYNDYWNFMYSFTKKNTLSFYLQVLVHLDQDG